MTLSRWLLAIAVMVGLGCLQAAQRITTLRQAYAVGERAARLDAQQTEVSWLTTRVAGLASPVRLSQVAKERDLAFVAWSALPDDTPRVETSHLGALVQVASTEPGSD